MIEINDKANCCGCEACTNVCPKNAIVMVTDEKGFLFPSVETSKCVNCGLCEMVCPLKNDKSSSKSICNVYAAINKNKNELHASASGGVFSALAHYTISNGGVVFGCAWDEEIKPYHTQISDIDSISLLQGSKYVQSIIGKIYNEVKNCLEQGKNVLFSGTPCQCDGLRNVLKKEYDNLVCVELVCHGVPSPTFFREYLDLEETKIKGVIKDVRFRDKKRGWGALLKFTYIHDTRKKEKYYSTEESFFYNYFWKGYLYRDSCYQCKYASLPRKSDITIGDYWGVNKYHPNLDTSKGVSVVIVSSEKGMRLLDDLRNDLVIVKSDINAAINENAQINRPSKKGIESEIIWNQYFEGGISAVQKYYFSKNKLSIFKGKIKRMTPLKLKKVLKKLVYG